MTNNLELGKTMPIRYNIKSQSTNKMEIYVSYLYDDLMMMIL